MLDPPQIVQTDAQLTALIRLTVPRVEIMCPRHDAGYRYGPRAAGPTPRRNGSANDPSWALRETRRRVGRVT